MSVVGAAGDKISACVDCATPIIEERQRCPAYHEQHAAQLSTVSACDLADEAVTLPRDRSRRTFSIREVLAEWLGACLVVVVVVVVTAARSCQ